MLVVCAVLAASLSCAAQNEPSRTTGAAHPNPPSASSPSHNTNLGPEEKFVVDTVNMAVALPQPDPQDRLRVLASAAEVVSTVDRTLAKTLWKQGVQVESELVRTGKTPAVSMMAGGHSDCAAAQNFIENLPQDSVVKGEQALIGAVSSCPKETVDPVSRKLDPPSLWGSWSLLRRDGGSGFP